MAVFLKRMLTVFLDRVRPLSRVANPRCMMKTSIPAIMIQRLLVVNASVTEIAVVSPADSSESASSVSASSSVVSASSVASSCQVTTGFATEMLGNVNVETVATIKNVRM